MGWIVILHINHYAAYFLLTFVYIMFTRYKQVLSELSKPSATDPAARKLHYAAALHDLGVLLYAQYAEYQHDAQLGAGTYCMSCVCVLCAVCSVLCVVCCALNNVRELC